MNKDLEVTLDVCLNEIEAGKADVATCLGRYPEEATELKPLLEAATRLRLGREVMPSPTYKARARTQLNVYMQQNPQGKRVSPIFWRFAISMAAVLLIFLASSTAFAQTAVPGDAFYNWKLTSESIWRWTSADSLTVDLALSNRRMYELITVADNDIRRPRAVQRYESLLIKLNAEQDPEKRARIEPVLRSQHQALLQAGVFVPELEIYFPR